ncbi:hypothetical protein FSP39_018930 [Pinctada imbricata]|uniref:H-type lectin domain-containing protein n=1 Tax=Pinctada imbricata TaxID=66713 RepID=A0AA89BXN4_PINIB|nr:hypothetical protein FSP39_018930 [Pinctada imbricata]
MKFEPPFSKTPAISFGMTHLRSDYRRNVRAIVKTKNITRYGFELILKSDGDTIQWALGATWMACPAR